MPFAATGGSPAKLLVRRLASGTRVEWTERTPLTRHGRSEVTRGKIIDAAVELVNDGGCSSTGLGDIVERAG